MAITVLTGHSSQAFNFFNSDTTYVGIGKTSAWADESVPDTPDIDSVALTELIGLKKITTKYMVIPDDTGTIVYRDKTWKVVSADVATIRSNQCRWVYIRADINYDELPIQPFRQVGVFSRVVPKGTVPPGQQTLLPSEIDDIGFLEILDHRCVVYRQEDQRESISMVLEF